MRIALFNSRKPQLIEPNAPWLRWTMLLAHAIGRRGDTLCTSLGTLSYEAALYGAAKAVGHIKVFTADKHADERMVAIVPRGYPNRIVVEHLPFSGSKALVQRDEAVMEAADLAIGVCVRRGGHIESLLQRRFHQGQRVEVLPPRSIDSLMAGNRRLLGAGIPLLDPSLLSVLEDPLDFSSTGAATDSKTIPWQLWSQAPLRGRTLSHFTRSCHGPWPRQTHADYLEDLWQGGEPARRDGEAALLHILKTATLVASSRLIRGGYEVVSLTAAHPDQIEQLHRYRRHLIRWDFEPYGVVFDHDWVVAKGARPVNYLPSSAFLTLPDDDRPYFQKHEPPDCDYHAEQEWRILGDLDFTDATQDVIRIVVP